MSTQSRSASPGTAAVVLDDHTPIRYIAHILLDLRARLGPDPQPTHQRPPSDVQFAEGFMLEMNDTVNSLASSFKVELGAIQ